MFGILKHVTDFYDEFMALGDPRFTKWFLLDGPGPIFTWVFLYVLFVKFIGPVWMKDREPFDLRYVMSLYNLALVIVHVYFLPQAFKIILMAMHRGLCSENFMTEPDTVRLMEMGWWFLLLKIVEMTDTIFFVLRKKFRHISKLHVIHHSSVPIVCWIIFRVEPAIHNFFFPFVNSTVHVIMYSYYGLSALGPNIQKYLWWKKYLTFLQMAQFVSVFFYMAVLVTNCKVSKFIIGLESVIAGLFLLMFYDYYRKTYLKADERKKSRHHMS